MPSHPLINIEIQRYYQNEPRLNGVYSRDNLPSKINNGAYVTNLDEYPGIGTLSIVLHVNDGNTEASNNAVTYFNSFGVQPIPKEIKKKL